jgi:hypothetical protein
VLRTKGLRRLAGAKSKNASKLLALWEEGTLISNDYYMPGVTVCQEKM